MYNALLLLEMWWSKGLFPTQLPARPVRRDDRPSVPSTRVPLPTTARGRETLLQTDIGLVQIPSQRHRHIVMGTRIEVLGFLANTNADAYPAALLRTGSQRRGQGARNSPIPSHVREMHLLASKSLLRHT